MSIGGFKYALIFVDRATRFNWCFGLKSLQHDDIISAFLAFRDEAGNLARQFRCDCDEKLFGSRIRSFLHQERSSIVSSPAGRQSAQSCGIPLEDNGAHVSRVPHRETDASYLLV